MKKSLIILFFLCLNVLLFAQGKLSIGFRMDNLYTLTQLSPKASGDYTTTSLQRELFNFGGGLSGTYTLESGLSFSSGVNYSRKRLGFMHEEDAGGEMRSLMGHSEFRTLSVPVKVAYIVYSNSDPYFDLIPFAGIAVGKDFISYRNLTARDELYNYDYALKETFPSNYLQISGMLGVEVQGIIEGLGTVGASLSISSDILQMPSFQYSISSSGNTVDYEQNLRMNYVTLGVVYYFRSWELFDGRLMRQRY